MKTKSKPQAVTHINHAVKERPDGFGALCGSLSLTDTLLKRKDVTCPNCAAMIMRGELEAVKPSPLPWRYGRFDGDGFLIVQGAVSICSVESEKDAALIARAVNAHAGMVRALRDALRDVPEPSERDQVALTSWQNMRAALRAAGEAV